MLNQSLKLQSPRSVVYPPVPKFCMSSLPQQRATMQSNAVEDDLAALESILENLKSMPSTSCELFSSTNQTPTTSSHAEQTSSQPPSKQNAKLKRTEAMRRRRKPSTASMTSSASSLQSSALDLPGLSSLVTANPPTNTSATWSSAAAPNPLMNINSYLEYIFEKRIADECYSTLDSSLSENEKQIHLLIYKHYLALYAKNYLTEHLLDNSQYTLNDVCVICVDILKSSSLFQFIK